MVKILHLFPNLMNLYGDYANIVVLKKHLEDQGVKVKVDYKEIGEKLNLKDYDFIYMGSGTERKLYYALTEIIKYKKEFIDCVNSDKVILFTGNAMELLGKKIGNKEALGVFDFDTKITDKRYTGDVIVRNKDLGFVVGFINRNATIKSEGKDKLFDYIFIDNNLIDNEFEGFHKNNTYATHIIGPVLVKNPDFMNTIVKQLLPAKQKYKDIKYKEEVDSYIVTLNALKDRIE